MLIGFLLYRAYAFLAQHKVLLSKCFSDVFNLCHQQWAKEMQWVWFNEDILIVKNYLCKSQVCILLQMYVVYIDVWMIFMSWDFSHASMKQNTVEFKFE
jgi:hypothetical protein